MARRILIIANKWFEIDPLIGALSNSTARPLGYSDIHYVRWPAEIAGEPPGDAKPRAILHAEGFAVELWCIQDLMDPSVLGGYSNTAEKGRVLPKAFASYKEGRIEFVVAVGTAASNPNDASYNGSVMVGSRVFIHNPYRANPDASPSKWNDPEHTDQVIPSTLAQPLFNALALSPDVIVETQTRLLMPFGNPAINRVLQIDPQSVAVSSVNVVAPSQYSQTDPEALKVALASGAAPLVSFESTHGIIRLQSEAPFLFVSGITNRMGHFLDETNAHPYTQNFIAAHNAGIALAWLLPFLVHFLEQKP